MKLVTALIDYDNVRSSPERRAQDVEANLAMLIPRIANRIATVIQDSEEILFRLYGGWIHLDRQYTQQAGWLLGEVGKLRGRQGVLRARLTMATNLVAYSGSALIGTYREGGQKMVDEMISVDLVHLADDHSSSLVLVSDDEDFVPGLLTGASRRSRINPIVAMRRTRPQGSAPNDGLLTRANVVIVDY